MKKPIVILDTSTVFNFGHRGHLEALVLKLSHNMKFWVTPQVISEIRSPAAKDYFHQSIQPLIEVKAAVNNPFNVRQLQDLDDQIHVGEISVIALALEHKVTASLDEKDARKIAQGLGIKVTGTLGLMKMGFERGYLTDEECLEAVQRMKAGSFRIPQPGVNDDFMAYLDRILR